MIEDCEVETLGAEHSLVQSCDVLFRMKILKLQSSGVFIAPFFLLTETYSLCIIEYVTTPLDIGPL